MKKAKKILTLALCLLVLFATLAVAHAIDERGAALPQCPECGNGVVVEQTETRTSVVKNNCEHDHNHGLDTWIITYARTFIGCDSCDYVMETESWRVESEELVSCGGYDEYR